MPSSNIFSVAQLQLDTIQNEWWVSEWVVGSFSSVKHFPIDISVLRLLKFESQ